MTPEPNTAKPVQLHVIHDLGGGSAKWLRDFATADDERTNFVLRSFTHGEAAGGGIALFTDAADDLPVRTWNFEVPIPAAVVTHAEYRAALAEVIASWRVNAVLVSSFIGHSLDLLETGLPTAVVNHDYFPFCAAINLERAADGAISCPEGEGSNPFTGYSHDDCRQVRERYLQLVAQRNVTMVVPSNSVAENFLALDRRFAGVAFVTIPHGYAPPLVRQGSAVVVPGERLRILVLGQLSRQKGADLLKAALPEITRFADVYLLGCREVGELFRFEPHVHVLSQYELLDLPGHVASINPHVGLLMSTVAETYSYALSELMMLGVPAAATRIGSFAERIRHGENGFLFEPDARSMVEVLRAVDKDRARLARIAAHLQGWSPRPAAQMVAAYHRVTPIRGPALPAAVPLPVHSAQARVEAAQAMTLASMWKEVKRLNLQLSISYESRHHAEGERQREARGREDAERGAQEVMAALTGLEHRIQALSGELQQRSAQLDLKRAQLEETLDSTSWRISSPVRWVGHAIRKAGILGRSVARLGADPAALPGNLAGLARAWRAGGVHEVKKSLLGLMRAERAIDAWKEYRQTFRRDVRPRIVERVRTMATGPLVSVLVPTYNPPEKMLREMLDSVRGQLYPRWELCIADDGSTEPHVARVLQEYASRDPRIKLALVSENRGVSHASNRALALASADFVVLLDHDDMLEEQALFRVAESILEDAPDMLYSDEVTVTPEGERVRDWIYRPAFSPEFHRAHPYIVHLVGFRRELLREVGGFDETLSLSQDYDLILRAAERAQCIVHIPEILYRWRTHASSAGHLKMGEVMEVSKAVLKRHLERSGVPGTVDDGAGFNFFAARYPLREGLKVAIIIPTKNHGELLRQCIDSLRATVGEVPHEILVVDHQSDDAQTLSYLASIAPDIRVARYEGSFNFSRINNWAVAQLDGSFSHYLLCNNDIEALRPGWLARMLELGQQPGIGIVGAKLFYPDRKTIQHAGVCFGAFKGAEHYGKFLREPDNRLEPGYFGALVVNHEVAAVTAACLLVSREAFAEVSGFDEEIAVGFGDVDLCLRVGERGLRVVLCPEAELVHHESYTRGTSPHDPHPRDTEYFQLKWRELMKAGDPYYSPGLSLTSTTWAVERPIHCEFAITRRVARRSGSQRMRITFSH